MWSARSLAREQAGLPGRVAAKQDQQREEFAARRRARPLLPLAERARAARGFDWAAVDIPRPEFLGARTFDRCSAGRDRPLHRLGPFLQRLGAARALSRHPGDPVVGPEATKLFADAQALLARIVGEKRFTANAVIGFWPCNAVGDDIEVYADEARSGAATIFHMLRQQLEKPAGQFNHCLADYIAPRERAGSTTSAASPSPRATASRRSPPNSGPPLTTTTRSWARPSATGWPRRWRRCSTSGPARPAGSAGPRT